jgi:hypothetical protein
MTTFIAILMLGFFLGMRHATDPDHVIAIATIVSRERSVKQAAAIGGLWGVGHTLTIVAVGAAIILFKVIIPARLGLSMEMTVALMLILLGVLNLTGVLTWLQENLTPPGHVHTHTHVHDGVAHLHSHMHWQDEAESHEHHERKHWLDRRWGKLGVYQTLRPLVIGIVHGLAGSAAVALLVLTTIRNPYWAAGYLAIFGGGTIAGMVLITVAMAGTFTYGSSRMGALNRHLATACGLLSVAFGCFLAYHIAWVDGLVRAHPHWTPH